MAFVAGGGLTSRWRLEAPPRLPAATAPRTLARRRTAPCMIFGGAARKLESQSPGSNPYRVFGITEDAEYEEVEEAYRRLCAKYADDQKMLMKLDVNKEAIMEDRLQKRMKGLTTPKVKESPFERKPAKRPLFRVPKFLRGIIRLPDRAHLRRITPLLGIFATMPFFLPTLASSFMAISGMSSMGYLYNRGLPEEPKDEFGRPGAIRPVEKNLVVKTIAIVCVLAGLGFGLAKLIVARVPLPPSLPAQVVVSTCVILSMWISAGFFQVHAVASTQKRKKGRGWDPKPPKKGGEGGGGGGGKRKK